MLFIMRGTSCSGKSTFVKNYFDNQNAVISSDNFREMLFGDITCQRFNESVFKYMHEVIEMRMSHKVAWTVYDATNLRMKDTASIINICKKFHCPFTIISIQPPSIDVLIERNQQRKNITGMDIPVSVLEKHHHRYEACMEPFVQEAIHNPLCTLVEINQNEEVIREIG